MRSTGATPREEMDVQEPGDAVLVEIARRDPQGFAALYERYADRIYRYALERTRSSTLAADIVSDTMLRALEGLDGFDPTRGSFAGWLFTIARNRLRDHQRADRRLRRALARLWSPPTHADPLSTVVARDEATRVRAALARLSSDDRDILLLRYSAGLFSRGSAACCGSPPAPQGYGSPGRGSDWRENWRTTVNEQVPTWPDDELLYRVLRSATLPHAQRQRHLQQITRQSSTRSRNQGPRPAHLVRQPMMVGLVVLLIVAIAAAAALATRFVPSHSPSGVSAAELMLRAPAPGYGRHITVEGEADIPITGEPERWTTDIWQRTLPNGTAQIAVSAADASGEPLGRFVRSGDAWFLEQGGTTERGQGNPLAMPPELANVLISPDTLRVQLLAANPARVTEDRQGKYQIVIVDLSGSISPAERTTLEHELGIQVRQMVVELTIDTMNDRLFRWREIVRDPTGRSYTVLQFTFTAWEETTAGAIDARHFAESATSGASPTPATAPVPATIQLPVGSLQVSSWTDEGPGRAQVLLVGPRSLVLKLDIGPKGGALSRTGPNVHQIQTAVASGAWQEDPQHAWPRTALWEDSRRRYALSVIESSPDGWSEADLLSLVETLAREQAGQGGGP